MQLGLGASGRLINKNIDLINLDILIITKLNIL